MKTGRRSEGAGQKRGIALVAIDHQGRAQTGRGGAHPGNCEASV
jgi:hypothetical protein